MPGNSTMDRSKNDDLFASGLYVALISSAILSLVYAVGMDEYIPGGPYGHPLMAIFSIAIVPQIFYRLAGRRFLLSRHHALVMSNFVLWMQIVYVFKFFLDIGISSFWQRWDNFVGPGFLLEMLWWTHLILNFRAGLRQAKKKTEFRASLTPWLLGSLQQSYFQTPVSSENLSVPVRPQAPTSLKGTHPARTSQVAGTSSNLPPLADNVNLYPKNTARPRIKAKQSVLGLLAAVLLLVTTFSLYTTQNKHANPNKNNTPPGTAAPSPKAGFNLLPGLQGESGKVARWNSCEPVRVVVNLQNAVPETLTITKIALKNVEQASGLRIEILGETEETYSNDRKNFQPSRYSSQANKWAPVLLDWRETNVFQASLPKNSNDVVGWAGPFWDTEGDTSQILTGSAQFDATWFKEQISQGNVTDPTSVIMHEFGHIIGLDHVDNKKEIMNPVENGFTNWGPGDRSGLAFLGSGPCLSNEQQIKPN
jgi:hypothetical protein